MRGLVMNKIRRLVILLVSITMIMNAIVPVHVRAESPVRQYHQVLRRVRLYSFEGNNLYRTSNGSPVRTPVTRVGNLHRGQSLFTGANTSATIQLDYTSYIIMDVQSSLQMLSETQFSMQSGNIAQIVGAHDTTIETHNGNLGIVTHEDAVFVTGRNTETDDRGTVSPVASVTALSGFVQVYLNGGEEHITVSAGQTLSISDDIHSREQVAEAVTTIELQTVALFALQIIYEHQEYLLDQNGILAELILEVMETEGGLTGLLEARELEQAEAEQVIRDVNITQIQRDVSNNYDDIILPWLVRPTPSPAPETPPVEDEPTPIPTPPPYIPTPPTTSPAALTIFS